MADGDHPRSSSFKIAKALKPRTSKQFSTPVDTTPQPKRQFPIEPSAYELLEEIGAGGASTVYRARCVPLDEEVAVKIIDLEQHAQSFDEIRKEITVMSQCSHHNIVAFYTSFVNQHMLWLVMECLEGGSCYDLMRLYYPNGFKNEELIASVLKQVLWAMHYFHSQGQIHRDIKASNILIASDGCVRLADFGVAAFLVESGSRRKNRQTFVGTPCWMAPEVMEQVHGYDYKADIWSLGITALELAKGQAPFATYPPMKVLLLTLQSPPPTLDDSSEFSRHFKDFIDQCLRKDPTKRPTAAKLLEHRLFRNTKKPEEVVKRELLKDLPTLGERARLLRQQRKATKDGAPVQDGKKNNEEDDEGEDWVFNQDSDEEEEDSVTEKTETETTAPPKTEESGKKPPASKEEQKAEEDLKSKENEKTQVDKPKLSINQTSPVASGTSSVPQSPKVEVRGRFMMINKEPQSAESSESGSPSTRPDDSMLINQVNHLVWQNKEQNKMLKSMQQMIEKINSPEPSPTNSGGSSSIISHLAEMEAKIKSLVEENERLRQENTTLRKQVSKGEQ